MLLRVIDIETTGAAPPAEVVEIGRCDVRLQSGRPAVGVPVAWLYRPLGGIPPETMAVHHLTESDFSHTTPVCTEAESRAAVCGGESPDVLVAHNCEFERTFISGAVTGGLPWICTYKVALRIWPDAPRYSNQVLRYWRGHRLDPAMAMPPHRAAPDAYVTAQLLAELLGHASPEEMIAWTAEPRCYPTVTFGKHRGAPWSDVPSDYLDWMLREDSMDANAKWCARRELERRG